MAPTPMTFEAWLETGQYIWSDIKMAESAWNACAQAAEEIAKTGCPDLNDISHCQRCHEHIMQAIRALRTEAGG